ncbi:hypothetical protein ACVWYN_001512 [Pedobacter sp. UYP24]
MNAYVKTFLLVTAVLIGNTARSQDNHKKVITDNLLGTWIGFFVQSGGKAGLNRHAQLVWRIHRIDSIKSQVELTDMGQNFTDGVEIKKPIKLKYNGTSKDSTFVIEFENKGAYKTFAFKFVRKKENDMFLLNGITAEENNGNHINTSYYLVKISDDTSKYVRPKKGKEVVVAIASPPPIKP